MLRILTSIFVLHFKVYSKVHCWNRGLPLRNQTMVNRPYFNQNINLSRWSFLTLNLIESWRHLTCNPYLQLLIHKILVPQVRVKTEQPAINTLLETTPCTTVHVLLVGLVHIVTWVGLFWYLLSRLIRSTRCTFTFGMPENFGKCLL